jgi:hypothetical protein
VNRNAGGHSDRVARSDAAPARKTSTPRKAQPHLTGRLVTESNRNRLGIPRKRQEAEKLIRWAKQAQAAELVAALPEPLAAEAAFSLATCLRRANVSNSNRPESTCAGASLGLMLTKPRRAYNFGSVERRRARGPLQTARQTSSTCLPYQGRGRRKVQRDRLKGRCKAAGLKGFRWHDLRAPWRRGMFRTARRSPSCTNSGPGVR